MKYFGIILSFITCVIQAQNIKVTGIEKLTSLRDGEFVIAAVSPKGDKVYASSPGYKGLYAIDINLKNVLKISANAGAGYEPSVSDDGLKVYFRSDEFIGIKRYSSLSEYNFSNGKTEIIKERSHDLSPPVIIGNQLIYSVEGKRVEKQINSVVLKGTTQNIYVIPENLTPVLYINGIGRQIKPNGEGMYIWVSLSPDKTRILYNYRGAGTYVCDLHGAILDSIGRLNAPKWLNNTVVIGMNDKDDGYRILSSDIISYSLITKMKTNLTATSDRVEMYPLPFPDGNRIVFQTLAGEIYLMNVILK